MPTVSVRDIHIYYEIHGEGEPLVLIAGLGGDVNAWIPQTPQLSRRYRVLIFDNRGVGRTDAPDSPYSIEMMADDTAGLLEALRIENSHVLGYSMGGFIAQELALRHPQRVKGLVLAATAAATTPWDRHVVSTWCRMAKEGVEPETCIREHLPWLFTAAFFENPARVEARVRALLANPFPQPVYALARQTAACAEHDAGRRIGSIKAPTLVLAAEEDILIPAALAEELAAGIPGARLLVLKGGAHDFREEISERFNQAVLDFLADIR